MPAARITLAHFSVYSTMNLPNSAGEFANGSEPRSASRGRAVLLTRPQADALASTQGNTNEALRDAILRQSKAAAWGLGLLALGTIVQIAAPSLPSGVRWPVQIRRPPRGSWRTPSSSDSPVPVQNSTRPRWPRNLEPPTRNVFLFGTSPIVKRPAQCCRSRSAGPREKPGGN
jgi:hypothetical protein